MARQKSAWDKLSMRERAQFIKLGLQHGLSDLKDIKDTYNLYSSGGDLTHKYDGEEVEESSTLNLQIPTMLVDNTYVETPQQLPITFLPTKGDYKVLDRNAEMYFTQQLRNAHQQEIDNAIASLNTRAKIKEVQTQLAEAGAYDKYLPTKKEDIKKVQRRLITLGFLPEEINGKKQEDGIIGKNTINAWRKANIDGILGQKTKNEYKKLLDVEENADWGISVDGKKDYCARFVSNKIEAVTGQSTKTLGVYGNGWNMLTNIVNKGGIELFNIYKNKSFNNISSPQELKTKTNNYLAQNKLDYSKLEPGDIVGIYIPSSLHHQDVLQSGSTYNTHVGVIIGTTSKGEPIVEHTINNKVYQDPISNIRGNVGKGKAQVTVAARPNYAYTIPKIKLDEEAISKYQIDEKYTNEAMSSFMKGMAEGEEAIQQLYPEVPMDVIQEIAIAVQKRETNFMTNRVSDQGFIAKTKDDIATKIRGEERKSTNTSKMKLGALASYERAFLDIRSKEDLEDPKKAGLAAELYLAKNYDYFKRLQQKYPELGITDEDIKAAVILSYNQGMSKLYSLGFDANGNLAHQELEELRKLADINTRIKDISSTNYRFLGNIGKVLYNAFEDPYQPYISAALEASDKYIHRMAFGGPLTHKKSGKEYGETSWLNNGYNSSLKSTGGPLYPFSFEKNPFLKTPVVRYDEGGQKQDASNPGGYTDEQLNKNYQIWKTYDPTGGLTIWNYAASQNAGNLARGEENEYWKEYLGLDSAVPLMNPNAYTEWDKQIEAQKTQNGELTSDFYGTTPRMDYNIQALADTLMLGKMVRNYAEYDKTYDIPHIETITKAYEQAKNILNNPNKWTPVDGEIPIGGYRFDSKTSETNPLGMLSHFGMKWVPEENALYMHDTYDFPPRVHKRTDIPIRPREMKIRSRINFDPARGSWLLRSADNYNTNIPVKVRK